MPDDAQMQTELERVKRMAEQLTDKRSSTALAAYANDLERAISLAQDETDCLKIII
jgi:hypothetical protein